VARQRSIAGTTSTVVDLRIAHAPDAGSDEDRCDRREYWVVSGRQTVLVAADCEAQWGADNAGPATTTVIGDRLEVHYVEFQSSDGCETVEAQISLSPPHVDRQERRRGTTRQDHCRATKPAPSPPGGDGSPDHPLVVLHRGNS
jgi:hypothetical protein